MGFIKIQIPGFIKNITHLKGVHQMYSSHLVVGERGTAVL